ncbi:MAG: hypothetical protein HY774_11415 [Acidobacteria bacterium]|nr:hypothetical protein [Acidobacteriota bacterium]
MKRQQRTSRKAGFTLLELVVAIGMLLVTVSLVGSFMYTELRAHQATEDFLKLNRLATQVATRLAFQKIKADVSGQITVDCEGNLIAFGEPKEEVKKPGKPVAKSPGVVVYRYVGSVRPISGNVTHITVKLVAEKGRERFASATYQTQ